MGGVSARSSPAASDLPDEAFGAALAGLDAMTPRRLWLLARSATSLRALWQAIVDGRPGEHAALAHLVREAPELVGTWARSAARVDPGALEAVHRSVLTTPFASWAGRATEGLAEDPLPPGVLFTRGPLGALALPAVAIIGTRHATVGGMETAAALGKELAAAGIAVVSGLAKGIDGCAPGALSAEAEARRSPWSAADSTPSTRAATPACGTRSGVVASCAPRCHPATPPAAHRFPARNRILAAFADVVVVVESRGPRWLTAHRHGGRCASVPVMAVPGSVRSPASEGTNLLLVDGATPVVDALDVLVTLGLEAQAVPASSTWRSPPAARTRRP